MDYQIRRNFVYLDACGDINNLHRKMVDEIDEYKPIKEASHEAKELFKSLAALERANLHRENPQIDDVVINLVRSLVK